MLSKLKGGSLEVERGGLVRVFESIIQLFFKVFLTCKCIKIIFLFIFKKLFLISAYQNNLKI